MKKIIQSIIRWFHHRFGRKTIFIGVDPAVGGDYWVKMLYDSRTRTFTIVDQGRS